MAAREGWTGRGRGREGEAHPAGRSPGTMTRPVLFSDCVAALLEHVDEAVSLRMLTLQA